MYSILHHDAKWWYGSLSLLPCEEHLKIFALFIDYSRKQIDSFKLCDHLACDLLFIWPTVKIILTGCPCENVGSLEMHRNFVICYFLLCISVGVLRCGSVCSCLKDQYKMFFKEPTSREFPENKFDRYSSTWNNKCFIPKAYQFWFTWLVKSSMTV